MSAPRPNLFRLFLEILAILAVVEFLVMQVLPSLAGEVSSGLAGLLDAILLAMIAAPLILWRGRRHLAHVDAGVPAPVRAPILWAMLALATGLALTAWRSLDAGSSTSHAAAVRFERLSDQLHERVAAELQRSLHPLRSIRGFIEAYPDSGLSEFRRYLASRHLASEFPGLRGVGVIDAVPTAALEAFVRREQRRGHPEFAPKTVTGGQSRADALFLIRMVEPFADNRSAIGLDVGSEPMRNAAAERSRTSGEPAITRAITLVQDTQRRAGALIMVPIYRQGLPAGNAAERQAAHIGWAYAPVVFAELLAGPTRLVQGDLRFALSGLDAAGKNVVLYAEGDPGQGTPPRHQRRLSIVFGGETLVLDVGSSPAFEAASEDDAPVMILIAGLLASSLLALAVWLVLTGRNRALVEASRLTVDLQSATGALVQQERRLHAVIQSSPYAVLIVDPSGRIRLHNAAAERIFGYPAQEFADMPLERLVPESVRGRHGSLRQGYLNEATVRRMGGNRGLTALARDGREIPVEIGLNPIDVDGQIHVLATVLDITERHAIEQELARYRTSLEQLVEERTREATSARTEAEFANAAKSRFLANMSHELRTPLHAIISFAELGLRPRPGQDPLPEKAQRFFERIVESGNRLNGLVNNLLELAQLDFSDASLRMAAVSLDDLLQEVRQATTLLAGTHQVSVDIRLPADLPAMRADRAAMGIALRQVVDNAIRYSSEGGEVMIAATVQAEHIELTVRDHGIGIPEGELERVFEPFVQSSRTASAAGGKGLGLAVARKIITAHQGSILARSPAEGGTCIVITLPIMAAAAASASA